MAMYFPGYNEAREAVQRMELPQLLQQIDTLYGRENLQYGDDVEAVRAEALEQIRREFTDTSSREYEDAQFWAKAYAATKANGGW